MGSSRISKLWSKAFITGANSGIGLYLTEQLLSEGLSVGLFDIAFSDDVIERIERIASQSGGRFQYWSVDLVDEANVIEVIEKASREIGPPDIAVNCAGIQLANPFAKLSAMEFNKVISVNLMGSRNFAAAVLPVMNPGSQLAFLSSLAGLVPNYSYSAYNASKFAVLGLAGALRLEELERNIAVSVICPGEINTPMVEKELETMHPVTRRLKEFAGTLELDEACDEMLTGLLKRKRLIIPGFKPKLTYFLSRCFPGVLQRISESIVREVHDTQTVTRVQEAAASQNTH